MIRRRSLYSSLAVFHCTSDLHVLWVEEGVESLGVRRIDKVRRRCVGPSRTTMVLRSKEPAIEGGPFRFCVRREDIDVLLAVVSDVNDVAASATASLKSLWSRAAQISSLAPRIMQARALPSTPQRWKYLRRATESGRCRRRQVPLESSRDRCRLS